MKDYLLDIVKNTYGLGIIDLVKVVGTEDDTSIEAISTDRLVILKAKTNNPIPEFIGTFGMPNLGKLNTILSIPEYKEDAKITVVPRKDDGSPDGLHFENSSGDFHNDYRFMGKSVVSDKIRPIKFLGAKWNLEFEPSAAAIQRLKFMSQSNAEESTFVAKTEGTDLKFYFGDHSTHAGNFVFQSGVNGTVNKGWAWPVAAVLSILSLAGDKTFRISDEGAAHITVNTGLSTYDYIIPALSK